MRKQLNDTHDIRVVFAPTNASFVSPQQVMQFLRDNKTSPVFIGDISHALSNVPADRWDGISTYLRRNWHEMSSVHIRTLTSMPAERLDAVLSFVTENYITNEYALRALSVIPIADLDDFKTFILNNDFIERKRYPLIFAHMPKDNWPAFVAFIWQKKFDENTLDLGMVYAQHPVDNWEKLFHLVEGEEIKNYISRGVIDRLTEMPPEGSIAYLSFLKTHQVTDWHAKNILVDVPVNKRACLYTFATAHNLVNEIEDLAKIPDAQWDIVTYFILKHPDTPIAPLTKLSVEQWAAFELFVNRHQMIEGKWISEFAEVSEDMRENLFIYQQEYNPKVFEFYSVSKIPVDVWSQFMTKIKAHGITDPAIINKFADAKPDVWDELALFMVQKNINDKYVVGSLVNASKDHYRALLAFVEQFNIHDQYIIEGLARIPDVEQWETIMKLSEPLLQPPLPPENHSTILVAVYEITEPEYRIDREMPIYGEAERQGRIAYALKEIADGLMPADPEEYSSLLRQTLKTPVHQLLNLKQTARTRAIAIDVHVEAHNDEFDLVNLQLSLDKTDINELSEEQVDAEPERTPVIAVLPEISDNTEKSQSNSASVTKQPDLKDKATNTRNWCNYFTAAAIAGVATAVAFTYNIKN